MNHESTSLERCQAFINSNFVKPQDERPRSPLALTISRQVYSRSHEIAENLIGMLQNDAILGKEDWALFDRDLVHRILEDHHLPKALERYMPEDRDRDFTGLINEILGLHPSLWELFHYTCDTIHKLGKVGNVILIGRGAHIITRHLPHVFHVRIISPLPDRIRRASLMLDISPEEARKRIKQDDSAREAYVRSHFDESPGDPLAYHMLLNTGKLKTREAARVLYTALQARA